MYNSNKQEHDDVKRRCRLLPSTMPSAMAQWSEVYDCGTSRSELFLERVVSRGGATSAGALRSQPSDCWSVIVALLMLARRRNGNNSGRVRLLSFGRIALIENLSPETSGKNLIRQGQQSGPSTQAHSLASVHFALRRRSENVTDLQVTRPCLCDTRIRSLGRTLLDSCHESSELCRTTKTTRHDRPIHTSPFPSIIVLRSTLI